MKNRMPAKDGFASGGKCKDFSLDLMHLSTNEIGEIKDLPALKEHIKKCPDCLKKLGELKNVDVLSFLAKPRSPEYQAKMNKLLERVKSESRIPTTLPVIDTEKIVGFAAGEIYRCLEKNGTISIPVLRQKTKLTDYPFYEAIGWLNRENKVIVKGKDNYPEVVELRPEREIRL